MSTSVRPSVCPSVTLVDQDHIGWKSWKIIARTISPSRLLFVAQRPSTDSQGNMGKLGETRGGAWKSGVLEHKSGHIYLKRVKIKDKLLRRAYRNVPTLFRTIPSPTPYGFPFPKIWGSQPNPKQQSLLSQERVKLSRLQIWPMVHTNKSP